MQPPFKKRRDAIFTAVFLTVVSVSTFFCGFGFNRFLQQQRASNLMEHSTAKTRRSGLRTSVQATSKDFKRNFESCDQTWNDMDYIYPQFREDAARKINASEIDINHRYLSEKPHLAGSERNNELGDYIAERWKSYGMKVYKKSYEVLLSVPQSPAVLQLLHVNGSVDFEPIMTEHAYFKEENDTAPPFSAYSQTGSVQAQYVYVNNGDYIDYYDLKQRNISLKGKIFISQYSSMYRGEKVRLAENHGAVAILLFPFPEDVIETNETGYPDSWGLKGDAMPRGSINLCKGDPLTPEWPSTDGMYRIPENQTHLPKIIVQPISYDTATVLLSKLDGAPAPFSWRLHNKTKIDTQRELYLKVDVPRVKRNITNVVGVFEGDTEPDRLVIMGSHRDSWIYGAGDALSGTVCMMEVARVLGEMCNGVSGWKPRRSLMFISWDAEEYGLVGSLEWLQEHSALMQYKTVAYLNIDIGVSGDYSLRARGTPSLVNFLYEITRKIQDPDTNDKSKEQFDNLYQHWKSRYPDPEKDGRPYVSTPKSGSDFVGFYTMFGVPITDVRYEYDKNTHPTYTNYPAYHTIYDNYHYYKRFIDPDTRYHKTISETLLRQMMRLGDDLLLPFNLTVYADSIEADFLSLEVTYGEQMQNNSVSLDLLKNTILRLKKATVEFHRRLKMIHKQDIYSVRQANDQLMWFERAFLVPEGIGNYGYRHAIYSPSQKNLFSRNSFPGLGLALYEIDVEHKNSWEKFKIQYSILVNRIENAIKIISDEAL